MIHEIEFEYVVCIKKQPQEHDKELRVEISPDPNLTEHLWETPETFYF